MVGPEPKAFVNSEDITARATLYAGDNSASETGKTVEELKQKTEEMLGKIFEHMRASRLLINSGKTNVMLFATRQKRATNNLKFHLNLEGAIVEEKQCARLLGLKWSNDFSWKAHIEDILQKCSKRLNGLYKVQRVEF